MAFPVALTFLSQYNHHLATKEQYCDIYFTFSMAQDFLTYSSHPNPQFEILLKAEILMCNQLACVTFPFAITFLSHLVAGEGRESRPWSVLIPYQ